jgi:hypothetical protein
MMFALPNPCGSDLADLVFGLWTLDGTGIAAGTFTQPPTLAKREMSVKGT